MDRCKVAHSRNAALQPDSGPNLVFQSEGGRHG